VGQAVPTLVDEQLYDEERACIAGAVPRRRAEFGTARVCARLALDQLGVSPCPIPANPDRSPRWPVGTVGSIAHTDGYCAVAVTLSSRAAGLGLDVEVDRALPADLEADVCTTTERAWLGRWPDHQRGRIAKLIFSAKEAFYKCQYPTTRSVLDFREVELCLDADAGTFLVARVQRKGMTWRFVETARGRLLRTAGLIVTGATLGW
jgi:4'-phosphopantetheinyl transferase EntD